MKVFFNHVKTSCETHVLHAAHLVRLLLRNTAFVFDLDDIVVRAELCARGTVMDRHKLQMRIMDLHNDVVDTVGFAGYDEHGVGEAACRRLFGG